MPQKHPFLYALASILTNMAVFGFAVFYILGTRITGLHWGLLSLCLLSLQVIDTAILKRPVTAGRYITYNLLPTGILILISPRIPILPSPDSVQYLSFLIPFLILLIYRICRACRPAPQSSSVLTVDGLIVLFIMLKLWHHINPMEKLAALSGITAAALLAGLLYLSACRLPASSFTIFHKSDSQSGPMVLILGLLLFLTLLGGTALLIGESTSSILVAIVTNLLSLLLAAWKLLCSFLVMIWGWLCRLLPDIPPGEYEAYEMPPSVEAIMERGEQSFNPVPFLILLAVCAVAAVVFFLYHVGRHILELRTGGSSTAQNEHRASHLTAYFRLLLRKLQQICSALWTLLAHPDSVPALLLRAHWYGRRRLHSRRKEETVREYLNRLDALHQIGAPAALLSVYADQYLYGRKKPTLSKEEIQSIKKAFPLL